MKPLSIRLRLTIWYSLVLASGLMLFGTSLWFALRQALYDAVDTNLGQHIRMVKTELAENLTPPQLRDELSEYSNSLPQGYSLQVEPNILPQSPRPPAARTLSETVTQGGTAYTIVATGDLNPSNQILRRITWMMVLAIPACLVLAGLGGYFLSRRALAPVDAVTEAARSITIRNLSQRLTVPQTGDEIQRLSESWNQTLGRLDAAVKRLTQFTADASHELRTPIALIRTAAELALRRDRSPEEYRETLQHIQRETERTSQLLEDLLALARADAGEHSFPVTCVNLPPLLAEAYQQARVLANGRSLTVRMDAPAEPVFIEGNEAGLRRLFAVLLDNAVKYTPSGEIRLQLTASGTTASVRVKDTGIGMAPEVVPHIFERFYRADESRNRAAGGAGLGLSIAQWIADRHGAQILVESAPGAGSSFTVKFPRTLT